ncbi:MULTISPECIES: hypothetical protein [unclassified Pseudonocardia]|uniref:hypothetical protein n=1 Tax=unclassified Pseudonocardia TaxID=2619320 RepID=UPI0001FFF195|nr:hypothetical protein [Pseudonocardia sp. Ae707_Ps1]OLM19973.1 hypothetical protein Ae707Ps1_4232 [Pseudonocardia sp. Ae707_Ps1]
MRRTVQLLLSAAVVAVGVTSGGTVYASQTVTAPTPSPLVTTGPAVDRSPVIAIPASSSAADTVAAARTAADDVLAEAAAAASRPRYTCEPAADARVIDGIIVNKDCPALNAAKEQAQRDYLEQLNSDVVGDHREYTCSDPTSADYGTAACGTDADGDGLMDDGPLDPN